MILDVLAQNGEQTSNPLAAFALPLLLLVGFYFLLIRPQRNRQRQQQALVEIDDDEGVLTVEIAPGTRVRMLRQGIAQRFVEEDETPEEIEGFEEEEGGSADGEADRKP